MEPGESIQIRLKVASCRSAARNVNTTQAFGFARQGDQFQRSDVAGAVETERDPARPEGRRIIVEAFGGLIGPVDRFIRREAEEERMRDDVDPEAVGRLVVSLLVGFERQRSYEPDLDLKEYRATVRALLARLQA